jgi:hypothetical protein
MTGVSAQAHGTGDGHLRMVEMVEAAREPLTG